MKLKLDRDEIQAMLLLLQGILDSEHPGLYETPFEKYVSRVAITELMSKLWKQQAKFKDENKITLTPIEMLVLTRQMPNIIEIEDPWLSGLINRIIMQISPQCLLDT